MEDSLIQFVAAQPNAAGSNELLVLAQIATPFVALATPFLVFGLAALRNRFRERRSATRLWSCIQKEARLIAFILNDSDGHWRTRKRRAAHTDPKHYLEITPIVGSPSGWATSLDPTRSAFVSDLWDAITRYNKWVEFYCAVNTDKSKAANLRKIFQSLDQIWKALQAIDPSIRKPRHLEKRDKQKADSDGDHD